MGELVTAVPDLQLCTVQRQMGRRKLVFPHEVGQLERRRELGGGGAEKRAQFFLEFKGEKQRKSRRFLLLVP